jgi:methylmalonyl-CoA/ethylmalonyl-CoA epimerase
LVAFSGDRRDHKEVDRACRFPGFSIEFPVVPGALVKLHHVGIVVGNIERQAQACAAQFGLRPESAIIHDPIQKAEVQFWTDGGSVRYEFIQPAAADSPVQRTLENGGGLAHLCFEVSDIHAAVRDAQSQGAVVVCAPVPAVAFDHRPIAFLFYRGMGLVEFVEEPRA